MKQCQVIKIATIQMTDVLNNLPRMGLSARPQLVAQCTRSILSVLMLHSLVQVSHENKTLLYGQASKTG